MTDSMQEPGPDPDGGEGPDLVARVLAGAGNCPADIVALAEVLATATEMPVTGDLATGAGVADRVTVLARLVAVLEAEAGRALAVADQNSLLPHAPVTHLQRHAGWTGRAASALTVASRFAARHPDLAQLWQTGQVSTEVVAAIARGLRGVAADVESKFLAAVVAQLPVLSLAGVKLLVAQTLDHLHPDDREAQEQTDWDRRCVSATRHAGMTMIHADLPTLEADALLMALNAIAESLRVEGDRLTVGQRRADALITLVNRAAAHGDVPATRNGLPVATTVTIGLAEADRVASQTPREQGGDRGADLATILTTPSVGAQAATLTAAHGTPVTVGDAAARFLVCAGRHTPVLVDDTAHTGRPVAQTLANARLQPLAVGRSRRLATKAQRTALAVRDKGCILCGRPPAECQTHHLTDWARGGSTDVDEMVLLCWTHHREVDLNRWTITRNSDPDGPHWRITPTPRHRWRTRHRH